MTPIQSAVSNTLVTALGWSLVHFLWQGAILSALLYATLLVLRRSSPAARYVAACSALVLMALCPVATVAVILSQRAPHGLSVTAPVTRTIDSVSPTIARETGVISTDRRDTERFTARELPTSGVTSRHQLHPATLSGPLLFRVVMLWLTGVSLLSLRLIGGLIGLSRLRRRGTRPVSAELQDRVNRLARQMGITGKVVLLESARVHVPTVVGGLRSVILAPASTITGLPTAQIEAILAHELAHIRRHDSLINLVQVGIETALFYHPAVWWVSRRIRVEREHCCDDLAIAALGDRITYARALTALEELRGVSTPLALAATGGDLLARVRYVLGRRSTTFTPTPATTIGVVSMLLCAALGLAALRPAQSSPDPSHRLHDASASERTHAANALRGEITPVVSTALRLAFSSLNGLIRSESGASDRSLDQVTYRQSVCDDSDPHTPLSSDRAGASQRQAAATDAVSAPQNSPNRVSGPGDVPSVDAQQDQSGEPGPPATDAAPDHAADRQDAASPARDAAQRSRSSDQPGTDTLDAEIDALSKQMESLGRQMDNRSLTPQQRADLDARMSQLGKKLSSQIGSIVAESLRQAHGLATAQIDQALREADAGVRLALKQATIASDVTRALRDMHIDEQVSRALRDAHVEEQVRRAMQDAHIEDRIQRAMRDAHVQERAMRDAQRAMRDTRRAMRDAHVADRVQKALRDAHVADRVQRALQEANIGDQVQRAVRDAHIDEQVSRALRQANAEIERALKEANIQIQRSTGNSDSTHRDRNSNGNDESGPDDH